MASLVAQLVKNPLAMQESLVRFLGRDVPFLRQQGIAVLEFPDDRAQLRNLKLETPSILFIQLLFLKQKSTANNCS